MWKRAIGVSLTLWICSGSSFSQRTSAGIRLTGPPASGNFSHHHFTRTFNAEFPFWPDYLPSNETAPSVIVVQAPAPQIERPSIRSDEPKSAPPLLIEWQGDRYVRRTSAGTNSQASQPDYIADAKPTATTRAIAAKQPTKQPERCRPLSSSATAITNNPATTQSSPESSTRASTIGQPANGPNKSVSPTSTSPPPSRQIRIKT